MAGTVVTGYVSTEEVLADERKIDMDERIKKVRPDDTQFYTMTSRVSARSAIREKVNWMEEEYFPRIVATAGAETASDTVIDLVATQGKIVQPNDILRNMRTNEALRVVSVATDAVTVATRTGGIAMNAADPLLVVADAQPQGSDLPVARYLARVLGYNYTQISRTPWTFTGTQTAIEMYGGKEPAKEAARKAVEHKRKIEATAFWGTRSFVASSASNGEPQGSAGGLNEFIVTNRKDANGPLTPDILGNLLTDTMSYGNADDKVLFVSPLLAGQISKWAWTGMGSAWDGGGDRSRAKYGVRVDGFLNGTYGYQVPVVVKKEWAEFPVAGKGYGGYGFIVDMSLIERRPLQGRDTKLLTDRAPAGKDVYAAEYMTETSWQIGNEKAHGVIFGVT